MTKPLSMDIRERAMARLDADATVRTVAEARSVAPSSAVKWSQRRRATGSVAPGQIGGHVLPKIRDDQAQRPRAGWPRLRSRCAVWWLVWPNGKRSLGTTVASA